MDFVYICREGNNQELRYSLRSVFQNSPVNSVWVVGGKPDWYGGNYIHVPQNGEKYSNAKANLRAIIDSDKIPDKFILMNDDFYIMNPVERIPVYHGGSLENKAKEYLNYRSTSKHAKILMETVELLKNNGVPNPLDYSLHIPMTIHKNNFEFAINMGGAIRSVYGNMNRIGGTQLPVHDVKVHLKNIIFPESFNYKENEYDIPFLSSSDQSFRLLYRTVLKTLSNPSPWELARTGSEALPRIAQITHHEMLQEIKKDSLNRLNSFRKHDPGSHLGSADNCNWCRDA
jgi:hypothetical protein